MRRGEATFEGDQTRNRILDFYRRYCQEWGYPPTVREVGEAVGLSSPATVHKQLLQLERMGSLKRKGPQEKLMPAVPR